MANDTPHLELSDGRLIDLTSPLIRIGSGRTCDFKLPCGSGTGGVHALLVRTGRGVTLCDQGEGEGTFVNGTQVTQKTLAGGDRIRFGNIEAEFSGGGSAQGTGEEPEPSITRQSAMRAAACSAILVVLFSMLWFFFPTSGSGGGHADAHGGPGGGGDSRAGEGAEAGEGTADGNESSSGEGEGDSELAHDGEGEGEGDAPDDGKADDGKEDGMEAEVAGAEGEAADADREIPSTPEPGEIKLKLGQLAAAAAASGGGGGNIFEAEGSGTRFVYVVDRSSSMAGNPFTVACSELKEALKNLPPEAEFTVIFYDSGFESMHQAGLVQASAKNIKNAVIWIDGQSTTGGTEPVLPVFAALEMGADTVFLLSDGEFDSDAPSQIRSANRNRTVINTVALHVNSITLKEIADDSGGNYRYVGE